MTRFDILLSKFVGKHLTLYLSGNKFLVGRIRSIDKEEGIEFVMKAGREVFYINPEALTVEGFAIRTHRKRKNRRKEKTGPVISTKELKE